ncbi:NAD-dependent protein deacylase [Bradymonadaceae bacterium TMQ3]|uniref:protein acetyllysine N-acetyltransferase n=1 Tax=Lujinxingia sediminis TaxID=2480984 RepID=A0ABY0CWB9_9DELT|nr:Sir2 family NAD-dependent protein deacetylase [Lujinxingia sediminis]RDV39794.1 NAD-dependent protein deacylase [Bradymonadaceae bacterium TMQ3]RVU48161.1 NAD-dependent protein deacylase [Lujinxingia sediminis]TXC77461.1 NAD-dependent protein deacylase [Bradymonadales bacterium TMQ1]
MLKSIARTVARKVVDRAADLLPTMLDPRLRSQRMNLPAIDRAAHVLLGNPRVLVCVGSGLSAESGVPTFRGPGGIYSDEEIAHLTHVDTFESDREHMLTWYQERREQLHRIHPNPGHHALIGLSQTGDYTISTQNVDHLLEAASDAAGFRPRIYHLHGSLLSVRCHACDYQLEDLHLDLSKQPRCPECAGPLRPGVVWFGETLPEDALERSMELARNAQVCLILGTSGLVYPAAALPETARRHGATLIEVNPHLSALSDISDIVIRGKTGEVLPVLLRRVQDLNRG